MSEEITKAPDNKPATTKQPTIKELLTGDKFKAEVALALPRHLKPDRFIRIALTAMTRTPKLAFCTPTSAIP